MENNTLYIKQINIENLWGKHQVYWELDPKVNILVGGNGSGKSTILNIIEDVLIPGKYFYRYTKDRTTVKIAYNNKRTFKFGGTSSYGVSEVNEKGMWINNSGLTNGEYEHYDLLKAVKISTFDVETPLSKQLDTLVYGDGEENTDCFLKFQNKKLMLQNELLKSKKYEEASLADKIIEDFYAITNSFFKETAKKIVFQEQKLSFEQNGDKINLTQLSAGEKQLLIILLTLLLQDAQPCLLLMDEPEISLDTAWQAILIEKIIALNPHCQLIIVTHSPSIFGEGWGDKLVWMEDIVK